MALRVVKGDQSPDDAKDDIGSGTGQQAGAKPVLHVQLDSVLRGGRPILGPVSFDMGQGETLALTGLSGVGKSTLLRAIAGIDTAYQGKIHAPQRIGVVFQEPTLLPWRNLVRNLQIATGISRKKAEAALAEVGLAGRGGDFPGQLSLGQQRRLSLARAFASNPDLLLLDEPFVSLDPDLVEEMMALFARLRAARGVATILVTHVEREAEKLASRILTLGGTPASIVVDRENAGAYFQLST